MYVQYYAYYNKRFGLLRLRGAEISAGGQRGGRMGLKRPSEVHHFETGGQILVQLRRSERIQPTACPELAEGAQAVGERRKIIEPRRGAREVQERFARTPCQGILYGSLSSAPTGLAHWPQGTHGLRPLGQLGAGCGLHSLAASRLGQPSRTMRITFSPLAWWLVFHGPGGPHLPRGCLPPGSGAAVGVDVVPPGAPFVVAQRLPDQLAHGAAFLLRDGLRLLQHVRRQGDGKGSRVPHGDIA